MAEDDTTDMNFVIENKYSYEMRFPGIIESSIADGQFEDKWIVFLGLA